MNTPAATLHPHAPAPQPTVLVVDDTPANLTVLGELLSQHYRVRVANSGHRALAAAASQPRPDIILLDIMMPGMDGYTVIQRLKADPALRDIPVIFVTAMDADAPVLREDLAGKTEGAHGPRKHHNHIFFQFRRFNIPRCKGRLPRAVFNAVRRCADAGPIRQRRSDHQFFMAKR